MDTPELAIIKVMAVQTFTVIERIQKVIIFMKYMATIFWNREGHFTLSPQRDATKAVAYCENLESCIK